MRQRQLVSACISLLISICLSLPLTAYASGEFLKRQDVQDFIHYMVNKYHFNKKSLTHLIGQVELRKEVIKKLNNPFEKEYWHTYERLFVSTWRIEHGVLFWKKYEKALQEAEIKYGIPASIIVATIGIETKYRELRGNFRVIDSLSNIAFSDSKRAPFFRKELEEFLLLTREEHLNPLKVMGSYAGAIGQPQFMPSSYRRYAVNFSKSGKIDLMNNEIDVIGSIANYYKEKGWTKDTPIATKAIMIGFRYPYLLRLNKIQAARTLGEFAKYGILPKGKALPDSMPVSLIELPNRFNNDYWLGFHNFYVIRRYNASDLYAMAVYQLSTYIEDLKRRSNKD